MSDHRLYERISDGYADARRGDLRIAARIHRALGSAQSVINIGAGTGNYEPSDRRVVAVEPSPAMIAQRAPEAAPVLQAVAESLPVRDGAFDASLAVLTVHHWPDIGRGLAEMARVSRRQVVFLFDPAMTESLWILDYFRASASLPSERNAIGPDGVARHLPVIDVQTVPVPSDCTDGFGAAYWGRPEAYLDPAVQASVSFIAQLDPDVRARATAVLADDLASGRWDERFGHLRTRDEADVGYRIVIADSRHR